MHDLAVAAGDLKRLGWHQLHVLEQRVVLAADPALVAFSHGKHLIRVHRVGDETRQPLTVGRNAERGDLAIPADHRFGRPAFEAEADDLDASVARDQHQNAATRGPAGWRRGERVARV